MILALIRAMIAIIGWDVVAGVGLGWLDPAIIRDELLLYLAIKVSFALLLAFFLTGNDRWARLGFRGGLAWRLWPALWPILGAALISAAQGAARPEPWRLLGWLAISLAIAFGEEGIFRGVILDAVRRGDPRRDRAAILVSALLFGLAHVVAAADPHIDARIVLGQACFATGIGLALAWTRLAAGSIWPCIAAHAVLDFFGILTSDGITQAMRYSSDGFVYLMGMSAIALLWGGFLVFGPSRRLFGLARQ